MLILANTTDNLQIVLSGAVNSNQLQCMSAWRDVTATTYTPGRTVVSTNDTTDVNLVPAPSASTYRVIDMLNVYNYDDSELIVTIKFDANGTEYILWRDPLSPGDVLHYADGAGFVVQRTYQSIKSFTVHGNAGANFTMTNAAQTERFAGNTSRHLFMVDLLGYTQVRMRANKMVGSASANTPEFRGKYYTTFNTTVGNFLDLTASNELHCSMTSTGYFDSGWVDLVAGARATGICIGFTEVGGDGTADPALGATDILFR